MCKAENVHIATLQGVCELELRPSEPKYTAHHANMIEKSEGNLIAHFHFTEEIIPTVANTL